MIFDFRCKSCEAIHEDWTKPDVFWSSCPKCGEPSRRILSAVRIDHSAMALSESASPESIAHFDRVHKSQKAKEDKSVERHNDYGKAAGAD